MSELAPWTGNTVVSPGKTLRGLDAESAASDSLWGKDKSSEPRLGSSLPHRPENTQTFGLRGKPPAVGRSLNQSNPNRVLLKNECTVGKWKPYECGQSASGLKQGSVASSPRKSPRVPKFWLTLITSILKRADVFCESSSGNAERDCKVRAKTECRDVVLGCNTEDAMTLALRRHVERKLQKLDEAVLTRVSLLSLYPFGSYAPQEKELKCEWTPEDAVAAPSSDLVYLSTHLRVLDALSAVDFESVERAGDLKKMVFELRTELNKERDTMESLQRTYVRQVKRSDFLATVVKDTKNEQRVMIIEMDDLRAQLHIERSKRKQQTARNKEIEDGACALIQSLRSDKKSLEGQTRNALSTADVMSASLSSTHSEYDRMRFLKERADFKVKTANKRVDMAEKALLNDDEHLKELKCTLVELSAAHAQVEALTMKKAEDEADIVLERQLRKKAEIRANKRSRDFADAQAHAEWETRKAEKLEGEMAVLRQELLLAKRELNNRKVAKQNPNVGDELDRVLSEEMANMSKRLMTKFAQASEDADKSSAKHREEIVHVQRHITHTLSDISKKHGVEPSPAPEVLLPQQPIHTAALSSGVEAKKGSERTAKNWAVRQMILDETEPVAKSKIKWDFRARQSQLPSKTHFDNLPCAKPRVLMPKIGKLVDAPSFETAARGLTSVEEDVFTAALKSPIQPRDLYGVVYSD